MIRLYESQNRRCRTTVTLGFGIESAELCDLLENPGKSLGFESGDEKTTLEIDVLPFEIITLKVRPKKK